MCALKWADMVFVQSAVRFVGLGFLCFLDTFSLSLDVCGPN